MRVRAKGLEPSGRGLFIMKLWWGLPAWYCVAYWYRVRKAGFSSWVYYNSGITVEGFRTWALRQMPGFDP